jgi:hypothetical protein
LLRENLEEDGEGAVAVDPGRAATNPCTIGHFAGGSPMPSLRSSSFFSLGATTGGEMTQVEPCQFSSLSRETSPKGEPIRRAVHLGRLTLALWVFQEQGGWTNESSPAKGKEMTGHRPPIFATTVPCITVSSRSMCMHKFIVGTAAVRRRKEADLCCSIGLRINGPRHLLVSHPVSYAMKILENRDLRKNMPG